VVEGFAAAAAGCGMASVDDGAAPSSGRVAGCGVRRVVEGADGAGFALVAAAGGRQDARGRQ